MIWIFYCIYRNPTQNAKKTRPFFIFQIHLTSIKISNPDSLGVKGVKVIAFMLYFLSGEYMVFWRLIFYSVPLMVTRSRVTTILSPKIYTKYNIRYFREKLISKYTNREKLKFVLRNLTLHFENLIKNFYEKWRPLIYFNPKLPVTQKNASQRLFPTERGFNPQTVGSWNFEQCITNISKMGCFWTILIVMWRVHVVS